METNQEKDLSVILPAYHEEENLRVLLPRLNTVLKQTGLTYEILVIDTEFPLDNTQTVCKEQETAYWNRSGGNQFGNAIRTGIEKAQGRFSLFMDADGSHTPEFIPRLLAHKDDYDVVIASRYVAGGYTENSRALVWMSRLLNWTYGIVLNLKCKDVSNSFKIYRSQDLKALNLRCDNFDIIQEILYKLKCNNLQLRIYEEPFAFKKRMFGDTKRNLALFVVAYVVTMIRLRLSP